MDLQPKHQVPAMKTPINLYSTTIWVKLSEKGLAHLQEEYKQIALVYKDLAMEKTQMERHARQDQWFEFSMTEFVIIFAPLFKPCDMEPLEDGDMHFECPYK